MLLLQLRIVSYDKKRIEYWMIRYAFEFECA